MASKVKISTLNNKNIHANDDLINEVINDDSSIDEDFDVNKSIAAGGLDGEERIQQPKQQAAPDTGEDEDIIIDDEGDDQAEVEGIEDGEIDEETGELIETPQEKQQKQQQQTTQTDTDRLAAQRREAVILNERNRQLTDAFSKVGEVKEPTEDELKAATAQEGVEWEELTTFERSMFKKNFINEQKLRAVDGAMKGVKDIDEWAKGVDKFLDDNEVNQTDKSLIGREGAFREFAMKESHRGVSMQVLVSAFLHDFKPKVQRTNGSIMLTKTGGQKVERKNNLADADYVQQLRKTKPSEYHRLLKRGAIKLDI